MQTHFRITNITCEACVKLSTMALREIPGLTAVDINIQTGETRIESNEEIPFEKIQLVLQEVGKEVEQISK